LRTSVVCAVLLSAYVNATPAPSWQLDQNQTEDASGKAKNGKPFHALALIGWSMDARQYCSHDYQAVLAKYGMVYAKIMWPIILLLSITTAATAICFHISGSTGIFRLRATT